MTRSMGPRLRGDDAEDVQRVGWAKALFAPCPPFDAFIDARLLVGTLRFAHPTRYNYRSNAALRRLSCGTSGLPIGARSVLGAWMVVSRRRTLLCKAIERAIRCHNCSGN